MLDHFNHLRRQWASKGQFLLANLRDVTTADMQGVLGELGSECESGSCQTDPFLVGVRLSRILSSCFHIKNHS